MTIDKIYNDGNLSFRSYHVCKYNEIETIVDLKSYYSLNKTFTRLRNCGEKSSLELIRLCNEHQGVSIPKDTETKENTLINKIQKLNRIQRQVINQFIKTLTSKLKVRSRNAITSYIGETLRLNDFLVKIFNRDDFQISKIKNIGKRYIPELELYLDKIKAFIIEVSIMIDENELVRLNNNYLIQNVFSIENIPKRILQSQSIIKLCEFLILENAFFKTDYNTIFINTINVFNSNCKTLDETALITNLTSERVRQIRQRCFLEISSKIELLKNFEADLYQNYEIDINNEFIIISDEKVNEINFIYDTHFSKNFLIYIISVYLSEQFNLIGNIEDVLIPKQSNARNRHHWKNIFLVKKEVQEKISLNKLFEDISLRLQEKINETYSFNFKSYLSRFLIEDDFRILEIIKDDCETLVLEEFNLFLDLDENIVFQRNTLKTASEYAFEALEKLGKPSKVEEIYFKIIDLFPDFKTDTNKVRASLKRKDGFVPVGRRSIFGLQKWEKQLDNFKGGTIRSIVKEYLDNSSTPLHISEITKYVLQYRPKTNEYSIIQNLKLDESKMFKFFENAVIGISGKEYKTSFTTLNSKSRSIKRTWEESYNVLRDFITENKRLPFSSNCTESEEIIYRWFNVQKSKINQNKLVDEKAHLLNQILKQFSNRIIRKRSNDNYNLDILLDFIRKNKRLPTPSIPEELKLYNFFYRKRKLYEDKELPEEEYDIITNILEKHSNQIRSKRSLPDRYEILLKFVKKNKRLPSATYNNEQNLYQFFYKQRKLYERNELDDELTTLFITIAKEIQNIKYENTRN